MASKQMLALAAAILALAVLLPVRAAATEHLVGDDNGWVLNFDYAAWVATKQFRVGDTLVFKYKKPNHTVVEVGGADFANCTKPATANELGSGEDRVALDKEGRRWFFCGVKDHCQKNMKLKITVLAAGALAPEAPPPPPPSSPAGKVQPRVAHAVAAVIAGAAAMLVL
uniref:Phytocyanin domain-containing protein n=1 Tax=Leersia perrieri TaxID=77586 RepID=A0A0D9W005_9ORYZ